MQLIQKEEESRALNKDIRALADIWLRKHDENVLRVFSNGVRLAVQDAELRTLLKDRDCFFTAANLLAW